MKDASQVAVETIVIDILQSLPRSLLEFYENPPGRRPSDNTLLLQGITREIGADRTLRLVTDVVDATIHSMLSLMDQGFKDEHLRTEFLAVANAEPWFGDLRDRYRNLVDPGGLPRG
jgi:hypothetical protein